MNNFLRGYVPLAGRRPPTRRSPGRGRPGARCRNAFPPHKESRRGHRQAARCRTPLRLIPLPHGRRPAVRLARGVHRARRLRRPRRRAARRRALAQLVGRTHPTGLRSPGLRRRRRGRHPRRGPARLRFDGLRLLHRPPEARPVADRERRRGVGDVLLEPAPGHRGGTGRLVAGPPGQKSPARLGKAIPRPGTRTDLTPQAAAPAAGQPPWVPLLR
ncbi:hypothetical protein SBRY_30944 [Actinacidiphila bryophytorum]|uniref:Uncharacterized protein n=1 Tax=Actinacidiphila bryophytorum TaxID=1436133 RepID=A0A9W4H236_9ACTN|nr:hypothetical protein SBRY_30944 [Actinacidiphila bryophytorum]